MSENNQSKIKYYSNLLINLGIDFTTNNNGIHLHWRDSNGKFNLYPTTEKLITPNIKNSICKSLTFLGKGEITECLQNLYKTGNVSGMRDLYVVVLVDEDFPEGTLVTPFNEKDLKSSHRTYLCKTLEEAKRTKRAREEFFPNSAYTIYKLEEC